MKDKFRLSMAGNTMAPCCVTLEELGYTVSNDTSGDQETWKAEKDGLRFYAFDPCQLLGLVRLVEIRGQDWQVSDKQIGDFINRYDHDGLTKLAAERRD